MVRPPAGLAISTSASKIKSAGARFAAESGKADAPAFRRDMAHGADGFQAMPVGVAPPFALVVENAAGVETEIAADRAHIALGRAGDMSGRLRQRRIVTRHFGMRGELAQRYRRANRKFAPIRSDRV